MIMSQERAFLKAQQRLQAMEAFVEQAARDEQRIDQVERELFSRLAGQDSHPLEIADFSRRTELSGRQNGPVNGMTFREARAVPE